MVDAEKQGVDYRDEMSSALSLHEVKYCQPAGHKDA